MIGHEEQIQAIEREIQALTDGHSNNSGVVVNDDVNHDIECLHAAIITIKTHHNYADPHTKPASSAKGE